ncbi:MAG: carbohydrate binding domain-containing protein [Pirellulales bacterium]
MKTSNATVKRQPGVSRGGGILNLGLLAVAAAAFWGANAASPDRAAARPDGPTLLVEEGFEKGLITPWGTGQYAKGRSTWWNSGGCDSRAVVDTRHARSGQASLHVINRTPRSPHVFGTTQMPVPIRSGIRYRISVWARARGLASAGAVNIAVDAKWLTRPISLPAGSYDWTYFEGEFVLPVDSADLRIISEDRGEAWLDDLQIAPLAAAEIAGTKALPAKIGDAAALFRQAALADYRHALAEFASRDVLDKFRQLDENVWVDVDPRIGWSYFVNVSIVTLAGAESQRPLVAFYNPWCDVFLITAWQLPGNEPRIVDAELVMGDWVRTPGRFPSQPVPQWLRGSFYKPAALGLSAAESVAAFQSVFADSDGSSWRRRLPGIDDEETRVDFNYTGVALLFADGIDRVDAFRQATQGEDPRLPALREQTRKALELAASGKINQALATVPQVSAEVRQALEATRPESFTTLAVVSTVLTNDQAVVFLAPAFNADLCLVLVFENGSGGLALRRIEMVCFEAIYNRSI